MQAEGEKARSSLQLILLVLTVLDAAVIMYRAYTVLIVWVLCNLRPLFLPGKIGA